MLQDTIEISRLLGISCVFKRQYKFVIA